MQMPPWAAGEWRFLTYLNFEVAAAELQKLLPESLVPDAYEGRTYVSVVAARCLKPKWLGLPLLSPGGFRKVGWQIYVRRGAERGVYRLKEIYSLPSLAAVFASHNRFGTESASVDSEVEFNPGENGSEGKCRYWWGPDLEISVETDGLPYPSEMWPYDGFFVDKRLSFFGAGPRVKTFRSEHPSWFAWEAKNPRVTPVAACALAGERAGWISGTPESAFLVKGGPAAFSRPKG